MSERRVRRIQLCNATALQSTTAVGASSSIAAFACRLEQLPQMHSAGLAKRTNLNIVSTIRRHSFLLLELKQFNQIARRIFQKSGATSSRPADFSSEFGACIIQPADEDVDVFRDDHESVPSARLWFTASSSPAACPRSAKIKREIIANERCELARVVHVNLEFEFIAIKRDRTINVCHNVSDGCHGSFSLRLESELARVNVVALALPITANSR